MAEVKRAVRVAERIREELASLLARDVRDPRVVGAVVSRVEMPDDLHRARVFFRLLSGGDDLERRAEAAKGLARAAGMLRSEVTKRLALRHAPALTFTYDASQEKMQRIEELLYEVSQDIRRRSE